MANKKLTYSKILIVIGSGIAMALGGCGLFLTIGLTSHNNGLPGAFALLFAIGVIMVIVGVITLLVKALSGN